MAKVHPSDPARDRSGLAGPRRCPSASVRTHSPGWRTPGRLTATRSTAMVCEGIPGCEERRGAMAVDHTTLLVLAVISAYCLVGRSRFELKDDRLAWLFGFGAGVLGGAYGVNGPPLVAYGTLRRWSPERFRATLQGYFLPSSLVGMAGYWVAGLWVPAVSRYYLMSLPLVLGATALGRVLNRHMDRHRFHVYVHVGLMLIGGMLLIQSVWGSGRS